MRSASHRTANGEVPPEANNVNCLNTKAIIEHGRRHYPDRLAELFTGLPAPHDQLPMAEVFLSNENNWAPIRLVVQMFANARRISGNDEVAFEIGYESLLHREFSYFQKVFLTVFSSPRRALRRANQLNTKLNTTKVIELIYDAPGRAVVRWHWLDGIASAHDICTFNRGIYSAITTLWGLPPAQVVETTCTFEGGPYCEVTLTWSLARGAFKNLLGRMFTRRARLYEALEEIEKDKALLKQRFDEVTALNRELGRKVTVLKTINTATRTLVSEPDTQRVLEQTLKPIVEVLGFDRALIMTVDSAEQFLEYRYGFGEEMGRIEKLRDYRIPLDREQNLMIRVLRRRRPVLIRDAQAAGLNPTNRILQDFRPSSFVVCPLIAEGRTIGILGVDRRTTVAPITQGDVEYLSVFANNIASAFQRARLDQDLMASYEERTRMEKRRSEELKLSYEGAVGALVKAIEVNDTYTGDHSDRVSKISVKIARRLGYDDSQLDDIRFGCILHDVGKIGLASYLELQKDGPLTDEEYEKIKEHPVRGEEILQANAFFKQNHRTIVRNHHERWDGKGYPDGLAGDQIPPEARIVAVADAYDAMTSDRRYRKGMPAQKAVEEIVRCTGTQFSRKAVEAFLQVYESGEINGHESEQKR